MWPNIWIIGLLILGYLSQDTMTLKMIKVSIPSYKMRGEIAILECHYQLETIGRKYKRDSYANNDNYSNDNDKAEDDDYDDNDNLEIRTKESRKYGGIVDKFVNRTMDDKFRKYFLTNDDDSGNKNRHNAEADFNGHHRHHQPAYHSSSFQPEMEALYSVKWYKDTEEFYSYVPRDNPPQHSYPVDGINIDHKLSNDRRVVIRPLYLRSKGLYRCEVSTEAPRFTTVHAEQYMEVIYLPTHGPKIRGGEDLKNSDFLNLTCISGKSYPASKLSWLINNETITDPKVVKNYREVHHTHGLVTTMLSLQLTINENYFEEGALRVKCVATISPVIWHGDKESVLQWKTPPPLIDNREAMFLVRGSATRQFSCLWLFLVPLVMVLVISANSNHGLWRI